MEELYMEIEQLPRIQTRQELEIDFLNRNYGEKKRKSNRDKTIR